MAGAVWDIARRQDVDKLCTFLATSADQFFHRGKAVADHPGWTDPVFSQYYMLNDEHR